MELINNKVSQALPKLYATEDVPLKDKMVICKFYAPESYWSWFVFEGETEQWEKADNTAVDDVRFFGMVYGHEREQGYFLLSEFQELQQNNIAVLRDKYIHRVPYCEVGRLGQQVTNQTIGLPDTSLQHIAYHQYAIEKVIEAALSWLDTWLLIADHNQWIRRLLKFNRRFFHHCGSAAELHRQLSKGHFQWGQAFTLGNLCFLKQFPNEDQYIVIKENIAFDIWPLETLARHDEFMNNIHRLQNLSNADCIAIGQDFDAPLGHGLE